ncbi:MAG: hypothetical protein P8Y35_08595 [Sulfurovaceae bacterium]
MGLTDPSTKKAISWGLRDGDSTFKRVRTLTEEEIKLPIEETCNDTMLISRIESEWTPEQDPNT